MWEIREKENANELRSLKFSGPFYLYILISEPIWCVGLHQWHNFSLNMGLDSTIYFMFWIITTKLNQNLANLKFHWTSQNNWNRNYHKTQSKYILVIIRSFFWHNTWTWIKISQPSQTFPDKIQFLFYPKPELPDPIYFMLWESVTRS